jgi:hypothetical protein
MTSCSWPSVEQRNSARNAHKRPHRQWSGTRSRRTHPHTPAPAHTQCLPTIPRDRVQLPACERPIAHFIARWLATIARQGMLCCTHKRGIHLQDSSCPPTQAWSRRGLLFSAHAEGMQVELYCCSPHHCQQQPQPYPVPRNVHLHARHHLHRLISFSPSTAVISGLLSQAVQLEQQHAVAYRQLTYLAVAQDEVSPWSTFWLRQTWNCPSVLNLILNRNTDVVS